MTPDEWLLQYYDRHRGCPYPGRTGVVPRPILDIIDAPGERGIADQYHWHAGDPVFHEVITCPPPTPPAPAAADCSPSNAKDR